MPAWPDLSSSIKPLRSTGPRPVPRTSRPAMQALQAWRIWSRTGGKQTREVRVAANAVAQLSESDRQCAEAWLAGGFDKEIAQRLAVAVETVARVRFDLLADVAHRLAQRPARAPVDDDWCIGPSGGSGAL